MALLSNLISGQYVGAPGATGAIGNYELPLTLATLDIQSSGVVLKEVISTSDISLPNWTTTSALPDSYSNIGSSFSVLIPSSGTISLSITARVQNGTSAGANVFFGIRIGSTNYWLGFVNANGTDYATYSAYIYPSTTTLNNYSDWNGAISANNSAFALNIATSSVPSGTQTVQLISVGRNTAILKGTALTTRAILKFEQAG